MKNLFLSIVLGTILIAGVTKEENTSIDKTTNLPETVDCVSKSKLMEEINLQLYAKLEEDQQFFNKNAEEIQDKFKNLISKMDTFNEYTAPLTENSTLISTGSMAASFIIPGFDTIKSAVNYIAETDAKIKSYTNAAKNSKINVIKQKVNTFLSSKKLNSIDDIRNELDLYRLELVELSNDLKKVGKTAEEIQKFSVKADQYSNSILQTATEYGDKLSDIVNSSEYGKKFLDSLKSGDESKNTDNNTKVKDEKFNLKSIANSVLELKNEINKNSDLMFQSMKLADNLSASLATIKNFNEIAFHTSRP